MKVKAIVVAALYVWAGLCLSLPNFWIALGFYCLFALSAWFLHEYWFEERS